MNECEDELICDLAEYYHIYDFGNLGAQKIATFARGLRKDSRVSTKLNGRTSTQTELFFARLIDEVSFIAWTKTKSAQHGKKRPQSLVKAMIGDEEKEVQGFDTPEEFEKARVEIMRRVYAD